MREDPGERYVEKKGREEPSIAHCMAGPLNPPNDQILPEPWTRQIGIIWLPVRTKYVRGRLLDYN